jgi:chromosome partitioning protein
MGYLIAVGNLKGGTGKSTIAVNLAAAFAETGAGVVLVDADAQGTASDWHGRGHLKMDLLRCPLEDAADEPEAAQSGPNRWVERVMALRRAKDYAVIDLPPQQGAGIASALLIADLLLVPVTPSGIYLRATGQALALLRRTWAVGGQGRPACMLVPSRVDRRIALGRHIHAALDRFGLVVGPPIRQSAVHAQAFDAGRWIGDQAPASSALAEFRVLRDRCLEQLAARETRPLAA